MKDIIEDIDNWLVEGVDQIALATVVQTWGSAPRRQGAKMALTTDNRMAGSVSGGCVEGAVIEAGQEALQNGRPRLLHFGVADETAWDVGLACGGTIEVFVEPLDLQGYQFLRSIVAEDRAVSTLTVIQGPEPVMGKKLSIARDGRRWGGLGATLDEAARGIALDDTSKRVNVGQDIELFVDPIVPSPTLIMVGGVHIAIALAQIARILGYRTLVIDPRRAFGSPERFSHADQLIQAWPKKALEQIELTPETAVVLLSHDPKIDDPALERLLREPVFYIGALGSRKTHGRRSGRLSKMGFSADEISRIHAPIGLEIGAADPEEIALAIMAQIVAERHKGGGS